MTFGERLKQTRLAQRKTQADVAQVLHVTRQTISNWEIGHSYPDIDSLINLSTYYHLSLDTLLKEDHELTDTLRKPIVLQQLRPTLSVLMTMNVVFILAIVFMHQVVVIKGLLYIMGLLNLWALNRLQTFTKNLANLSDADLWQQRRPWFTGLAGLLSIIAISFWWLQPHWALTGMIIAGSAWGMALFFELYYRHQKKVSA